MTIIVDNVVDALKQTVQDYGDDWIDPNSNYSTCVNVYKYEGETRRCIAAQALHNLGFNDEKLEEYNSLSVSYFWDHLDPPVIIDPEALNVLQRAQDMQDKGKKWGQILEEIFNDYKS